VRVDKRLLFNVVREFKIGMGYLPPLYTGDLVPLDEPLWVLLHDHPLEDVTYRINSLLIYPGSSSRPIFTQEIVPILDEIYNIRACELPRCFKWWHLLVKAYTDFRLENVEPTLNVPVSVRFRFETIIITFHPLPPSMLRVSERGGLPMNAMERTNTIAMVAVNRTASAHVVRKRDPELTEIGDSRDLSNYLPDSGATQHMTLHLADLHDTVEEQNLGVEVEDGHIIKYINRGQNQNLHVG
jgi:hypothetical protein